MGIFMVNKEENLIVNVKKLTDDAVLPARAKDGDAGYDVVAIDNGTVDEEGFIQYRTGLSLSPTVGIHTNIYPRSSISKYDLVLANSIGLADNGYRGEFLVRFKPVGRVGVDPITKEPIGKTSSFLRVYKKGDKIAQLVFAPTITPEMVLVDNLDSTARGTGGFGSSGS